ncbi:MAG TPA: ATP-binding protein [Pseudothermotoga sp.]|nr:ATP-binding protein [Pseudothermotoga sp.]HOK82642.1 ATP-binding protein [Pseudothermotoga sp.]HPP70403.1 ATP-binding protein [Pseudothermotoga sp.]
MTLFLTVLVGIVAFVFIYVLARDRTVRNLKRFFIRVAELVNVPDDSPPSYVLETLRKTITNLEDELTMAQKSRENTMTLLDNIVDPILFVDGSTGEILFANTAAQRISRPMVATKKIYEALEDYYLIEMFDETVRSWQVQEGNVIMYDDGRKRYYSCKMIPVLLPKGEKRVVILFHDMTKEYELNEMRREFVSNVSHELRTPLTSIHGYAETLLSDPEMDPDTRNRFLTIIENESARMSRLINDLLDLERLESGEARFDFQEVDLCATVKYVISIVEPLSNDYGVKVSFDCRDVTITGDQDRLVQMLLNLVDNAIKYTSLKEMGEKRVEISISKVDSYAVIRVTDTGPGMPQEALNRIFDRFYRVDKGRSRKMGGSGLGLSIVKTIVDRHNGEISVESELGVGTTFMVKLPVRRVENNEDV